MDYEAWSDKIKQKIDNLAIGRVFILKELFEGTEWNQLAVGERQSLGRYFSSQVDEGKIKGVSKSGENKARHNRYIKTE